MAMDQKSSWLVKASGENFFSSESPAFRKDAKASDVSYGITVQSAFGEDGKAGRLKLGAAYSTSQQTALFSPYEVYYSKPLSNSELTFGKRLYLWSEADSQWGVGMWQPRLNFNKLHPEEQGLTGLFVTTTLGPGFHLKTLVSGVHVPDLGPSFYASDGRISSASPWFSPPPPQVLLFDNTEPTNVVYDLKNPTVEEVAFHPVFATELSFENEGRFARLGYANKPMNPILIGFPFVLRALDDGSQLEVELHPRVARHQLVTAEVGERKDRGFHYWLSASLDQPQDASLDPTWIGQSLKPAMLYSAYLGYDFVGSGARATHGYLSWLTLKGGDAPDQGELAPSESLFERRYQYQSALRLGLKTPLRKILDLDFQTDTSLTMDFAQKAMAFSTSLKTQLDRAWQLSMDVDVMGLLDRGNAEISDGFLRTYRANDRVALGLAYAY